MNTAEAILYGWIQGMTEFLPVSSSGHLAAIRTLFPRMAGIGGLSYDILLHFATLLAVVIACRGDVCRLVQGGIGLTKALLHGRCRYRQWSSEERLAALVLIGTLPLAPALLLRERIEPLYENPGVVGVLLMANGTLLWLSDRLPDAKRNLETCTPRHALLPGLCQAAALLPGLSRSGSTMIGGRLAGLDREEALRFSFLLSLPAVLGANLLNLPDLLTTPVAEASLLPMGLGMLTAALTGLAAIGLFRRMAKRKRFTGFALYCMILGAVVTAVGRMG